MREQRLFDQLDDEEHQALRACFAVMKSAQEP